MCKKIYEVLDSELASSSVREPGSFKTLRLDGQLMLVLDDGKQGVPSPLEVSAATLFEALDDAASALLDDANIALAHWKVLSLQEEPVLEVVLAGTEREHLLPQASVPTVQLSIVLVQVLLLVLLNHKAQVLDLTLDGGWRSVWLRQVSLVVIVLSCRLLLGFLAGLSVKKEC